MKTENQLIEIASWRFVNELHRRFPDTFTVIETHPGGGMYDCLALYGRDGHIADFNRVGRFHVFKGLGGTSPPEPWDIWREMHQLSSKDILDKICDLLRADVPDKLPASTPTTLVYRFIAEFLTQKLFDKHGWECRNGYYDSSGMCGCSVVDAFEKFPAAKERLKERYDDDIFKESAYRFWFIYREQEPVICLETVGLAWDRTGKQFNLADLYGDRRKSWYLLTKIAGDLLP